MPMPSSRLHREARARDWTILEQSVAAVLLVELKHRRFISKGTHYMIVRKPKKIVKTPSAACARRLGKSVRMLLASEQNGAFRSISLLFMQNTETTCMILET